MSQIKIRVRFNKGKKGVPLDTLENVFRETRKFLSSIAGDLDLPPQEWKAQKFQNRSISSEVLHPDDVSAEQASHFIESIEDLSKFRVSPYITTDTAEQFFEIGKAVPEGDSVKIAVFPNHRAKWVAELRPDMSLPKVVRFSDEVRYIGGSQGTLHSWYIESSYFWLRETSTRALIRCNYKDQSLRTSLAQASENKAAIIHVGGTVYASRARRQIREIEVDKVAIAKLFTFADVEEFLGRRSK